MDKIISNLIKIANSHGVATVDRELARHIIETAKFGNQRRIKRTIVNKYSSQMIDGRWNNFHSISFAEHNGNYILVNGYHRLFAIIKSGVPCQFRIDLVKVDSLESVQEWYGTTDTDSRGIGDKIEAYGKLDVSVGERNGIISASKILVLEFNYRRLYTKGREIDYEIKDFIHNNIDDFRKHFDVIYENAAVNVVKHRLCSGQQIALSLVTMDSEKWFDFWSGIARDDGLKQGDPRKTYLEYLKEIINQRPRASLYIEIHNKFSRCWDSWVKEKEIRQLRSIPTDQLLPIKDSIYKHIDDYDMNLED